MANSTPISRGPPEKPENLPGQAGVHFDDASSAITQLQKEAFPPILRITPYHDLRNQLPATKHKKQGL